MTVENVTKLSEGRYIAWTQAGFKKALREMQGGENDRVSGYPTSYPSVVSFSFEYRGYHYWDVRCVPLHLAISDARSYLDLLVVSRARHNAQLKNQQKPWWKRILRTST